MAQMIDSAANFEGFSALSAAVLHPWLAMGEQATTSSELYALGRALDALTWGWGAVWQYNQALLWLGSGNSDCVPQAMQALKEAGLNLRRSSSSWGSAANWLNEYGDPQKTALYQPLYQHALVQQQWLAQQLSWLQAQVALLCQEWGLPLTLVPDLSEGVADGCTP